MSLLSLISKNKIIITLFFIITLASFLRIYKIDQIPPSISWDEAAVGYNAYTIANWGKDEWGNPYPFFFKSFEDDKHPVHIYSTAISVKLLGLSDFSVRLPAAVFGILNVLLIFFLAKVFFSKNSVALISALFMAVSPYCLQFSRFNHEANFALFFFMLGLLLFFIGKERKNFLLSLSFLSFGICLLSYHSSKVVVPPVIIFLAIFYYKDLIKIRKYTTIGLFFFLLTIAIIFFNPSLLGTARIKQTAIAEETIKNTPLFQKTNNEILGRAEVVWNNYLTYFSPQYLFISGDKNTKFSIQTVGAFYKLDAIFLVIGLVGLIKNMSKKSFLLLFWALLAPLPGSLSGGSGEIPHSARALFVMGSWNLISAYGLYLIINFLKNIYLKIIIVVLVLIILGWMFNIYISYYYQTYPQKDAIGWQYGMKQAVEYVKDHNGYFQVYTTDIRFQPYIFFLYYLKTPLPEFRDTVVYNTDMEKRKYNLVSSFDDYHFGDWDPIESMPNPGVLYVVTPSQYDGLRSKSIFDVKKRVKYPDGGDAFFLVSYP